MWGVARLSDDQVAKGKDCLKVSEFPPKANSRASSLGCSCMATVEPSAEVAPHEDRNPSSNFIGFLAGFTVVQFWFPEQPQICLNGFAAGGFLLLLVTTPITLLELATTEQGRNTTCVLIVFPLGFGQVGAATQQQGHNS